MLSRSEEDRERSADARVSRKAPSSRKHNYNRKCLTLNRYGSDRLSAHHTIKLVPRTQGNIQLPTHQRWIGYRTPFVEGRELWRTSVHDTTSMNVLRSHPASYIFAKNPSGSKHISASLHCGERSSPETADAKTRGGGFGAVDRENRTFDFGRWVSMSNGDTQFGGPARPWEIA